MWQGIVLLHSHRRWFWTSDPSSSTSTVRFYQFGNHQKCLWKEKVWEELWTWPQGYKHKIMFYTEVAERLWKWMILWQLHGAEMPKKKLCIVPLTIILKVILEIKLYLVPVLSQNHEFSISKSYTNRLLS